MAIFGEGGHAKSVASTLIELGIEDFFYVAKDVNRDSIYGKEVVPEEDFIREKICRDIFIAIGNNKTRKLIHGSLLKQSDIWNFPTIIHDSAVVSSQAIIGEGTLIAANTYVGPSVSVGKFVIINTGSILEHDSNMSDFSSLGPSSATGGGVRIGEGCLVGLGAILHPNAMMEEWSTLGAASYLRSSIPRNSIAIGSPARVVKP